MAHVITYTHPHSGQSAFASGSIVLDVSEALSVYVGFVPSKIVLYLKDADTTENAICTWVKGMTAGTYMLTAAAGEVTFPAVADPVDLTTIPESDTETTGAGFAATAALFTALSAADDDVMYFEAWR